ncbi:MAG: enoyl-CoA hydratase/isomerase family protein [Chloroflexi bacterium]|nr:enoyl-CoA hydratase/isomerase family protein [Chloroflexota bacterium]
MSYEKILLEKVGPIASICFDRPEKLNAMNDALLHEFDAAVYDAEKDDAIRVLVFKGAGRSFSVGRDMSADGTSETLPPDWRKRPYYTQFLDAERRHQARWQRLFELPKVTIAQVQGHCLDWGLYLAMVCDFTIAAETAQLGDPAVRIGHVTPMPLWSLILGVKKAKEFLYTGRTVDGKQAERLGLVTRAVARGRLAAATRKLARAMATLPPGLVVTMKEGLHQGMDMKGLGAAWRYCSELHLFGAIQPVVDEFSFLDVRDEKGLKAAIKEANAPFKSLPYFNKR